MEETHGVSDSQQNDASGKSVDDLKQKYEQDRHDGIAYDSYKKAVTQYKSAKSEVDTLKSKLEQYEQERLESQGRKDEVIASLRKQLSELDEKSRRSQQSYTWNVVGAQIKSELAAKGVRNPEKALKYAKAAHKDDLSSIEVDEDYNVNPQDLSRFVDKFLMDNQDMGFVSRVGVKDIPPGRVEIKGNENKGVNKLSDKELDDAWSSLR